jgi:hypothetical protein
VTRVSVRFTRKGRGKSLGEVVEVDVDTADRLVRDQHATLSAASGFGVYAKTFEHPEAEPDQAESS